MVGRPLLPVVVVMLLLCMAANVTDTCKVHVLRLCLRLRLCILHFKLTLACPTPPTPPPHLQSNVRRMLGYFSLVGLLRVHSVLGDYATAIKVGRQGTLGWREVGDGAWATGCTPPTSRPAGCASQPPIHRPHFHIVSNRLASHSRLLPSPQPRLSQSMAPLHPFLRKSLFTTKIPMACITMFYYTG